MGYKTHARKGTGNGCDNIPLCGFNNSRAWRELPSKFVVGAKEFRATSSVDRCALCVQEVLHVRNAQRKAKGLDPVSTPFEGLTVAT